MLTIDNIKKFYTIEEIREHKNILTKIDWFNVSLTHKFNLDELREFKDYLDWYVISAMIPMNNDMIIEFQNYISFNDLIMNQQVSEYIINKFEDKIDFTAYFNHQSHDEDFMMSKLNKVNNDWSYLLYNKKLSIDFLERHKDDMVIYRHKGNTKLKCNEIYDCIIRTQKLTNEFILKNKNKLNMNLLLEYHHLDEEFVLKFRNILNLNKRKITEYVKLSENGRKLLKINIDDDPYFRDYSTLYKDGDFWKEKIQKLNKFECHDDYFIGYIKLTSLQNLEHNPKNINIRNAEFNYIGFTIKNKTHIDDKIKFIYKVKVNYKDVSIIDDYNDLISSTSFNILETVYDWNESNIKDFIRTDEVNYDY